MEHQVINIAGLKAARPLTLPERFAHLQSFAAWSLPTETERNVRRHAVSMEEIRAFADTLLAELDGIFAYLDTFGQDTLPDAAQALMNMTLSLAEVAPAVEFYGQQAVIDGFDPRRFNADESFVLSPRAKSGTPVQRR